MLVYVLIASVWSGYGIGKIDGGGEFATYDDCAHAAKMFFYGHTDKATYPFDAVPGRVFEMRGGINFIWHCEGYIR